MINPKMLISILNSLAIKMPNGAPKFDQPGVLEAWCESLQHLELTSLQAACRHAVQTFDFFPSIAKLCEISKDYKSLPSSQKALPGNVEDEVSKLAVREDLWGVGGTALRVELPEPQCFEKQYLEERVSFLVGRLSEAGIKVFKVDRNQGLSSTEGGRAEAKIRYVATIWMAKEGFTSNYSLL